MSIEKPSQIGTMLLMGRVITGQPDNADESLVLKCSKKAAIVAVGKSDGYYG
jgi:hypothetical protein